MSSPDPTHARMAIVAALARIAPEVDVEVLDASADLREEADLDSVDFMNLVVALHEELGVDIPESDYDQLSTLDEMVAYLASRSGSGK